MTVTFERVTTGEFRVLHNSTPTSFGIINGSAGLSGRDTRNMYGITSSKNASVRWIGSLASCKAIVAEWIKMGRR
jgi:hypothetical protein